MNWQRFYSIHLLSAAFAVRATAADAAAVRDPLAFFEKEVRPILVNRCYDCHSDTEQKGGLRVDHIEYMKTGGETGPALVPGKPGESPLLQAVRYTDADLQMPPKKEGGKLPDAEIAILETWISLGAPWPADPAGKIVKMDNGFSDEQRNYWFFKPVVNVAPPKAGAGWARNGIDRFIAQKHAELNVEPAPEAERSELVRRVYFDLHGLPPSREQMASFVNDKDPLAYEKLIDILLASPRYGERWAQHWLDLVRYAESDGYNADSYRPSVWPYRDYVIKSLNDDKPYDQFVREQLAGDEIAPDDPSVFIATAFLRHTIYEWNLRDVRGQWEVILTDMTDTTGELFLGLSMGCARCHNHKFDPILQKDYYRLRAFLAPVHWRDDLKLAKPEEIRSHAKQQAQWEAATAGIRARLDALSQPIIDKRVAVWRDSFPPDVQAMITKPDAQRNALEMQIAGLCARQLAHPRKEFKPAKDLKTDSEKEEYKVLQEELKKFDLLKPKPLMDAFTVTDASSRPPANPMTTRRGEQDIAPGFLTIVEPNPPQIKPSKTSTGRRTALANWITRPDNQLTTRVVVNRLWQYHFGRGIVATSSDFGNMGERPSHPELLDYLAARFVSQGWHFKPLHREIMLSATYRQTTRREPDASLAKTDPTNRYLWRFHPRRLDAEQVRDALLAVSGELDTKNGGPSVDGQGNQRSIYTIKKRNTPNELLRALDMPNGFASTAERQSTTTPTQALQLLNGDWLLARARKVAANVKDVDEAWLTILGRPPADDERAMAQTFLDTRIQKAPTPQPEATAARAGVSEGLFKINSLRERLIVHTDEKEGDDFTFEAIATLDSVDLNAELRILASRWDGNQDRLESYGWSIGVTGLKSRFKPGNLLVQFVGEDANANIGYHFIASNIHLELGRRYHIVIHVSAPERSTLFTVRDLSSPDSLSRSVRVPMEPVSKISEGASPLVIGGLQKRNSKRLWDGKIEAFRVLTDKSHPQADPQTWKGGMVLWRAGDAPSSQFTWSGRENDGSGGSSPYRTAMTSLCQVLLTTNEFFYLH